MAKLIKLLIIILVLFITIWTLGRSLLNDDWRYTRLATGLDTIYFEIVDAAVLSWFVGDENRFKGTAKELDVQELKEAMKRTIPTGDTPIFYIYSLSCSVCKVIIHDLPVFYKRADQQNRKLFVIGVSDTAEELERYLSKRLPKMDIVPFFITPEDESDLYDVLIKSADLAGTIKEFHTPSLIFIDSSRVVHATEGRFGVRKKLNKLLEEK